MRKLRNLIAGIVVLVLIPATIWAASGCWSKTLASLVVNHPYCEVIKNGSLHMYINDFCIRGVDNNKKVLGLYGFNVSYVILNGKPSYLSVILTIETAEHEVYFSMVDMGVDGTVDEAMWVEDGIRKVITKEKIEEVSSYLFKVYDKVCGLRPSEA